MNSRELKLLIFSLVTLSLVCLNDAKTSKNITFIATNEWQEIPEGMAIPAGLHVRINFETHKREAKLLEISDEQENTKNAIIIKHENEDEQTLSKKKTLLSDALKKLQKDGGSLKYTPEYLSQIKREFKATKDEFAETYENMKQHFQSDAEIITLLIEEYLNITNPEHNDKITPEERVSRQSQILESFDYMLHQIDNSMLFISQGGLDILLPIVANESRPLRVKSMRVLGVLTQNNPGAQLEVFKKNFPTYILKTLISSSDFDELSAALYAFGSLIRKFPVAQQHLLSTSGTQALVTIMNRDCELRLKDKAATIISDILEEYHYMLSASATEENTKISTQYKELNLYEWLLANEFCEAVDNVIVKNILQLFEQSNIVDDFIDVLNTSYPLCKQIWLQNLQMQNALTAIKDQYIKSSEEYRNEIGQKISKLLSILQNQRHEEL